MQCTRKVTDGIYWVGVNDRRLAKFENMFPIPRGVSYNSYVILDGKTAHSGQLCGREVYGKCCCCAGRTGT